MANHYFSLINVIADNFPQLHRLQKLVGHLLTSSTKKYSGVNFWWSKMELVDMFGYFFHEIELFFSGAELFKHLFSKKFMERS